MLKNIHVGKKKFKTLKDARKYCKENNIDYITECKFDDPGFVIITPEQQAKTVEIVNYINSIIKVNHAEHMKDYGIPFVKADSIDNANFNNYPKDNKDLQNWKGRTFEQLMELKQCYASTCDIPLD